MAHAQLTAHVIDEFARTQQLVRSERICTLIDGTLRIWRGKNQPLRGCVLSRANATSARYVSHGSVRRLGCLKRVGLYNTCDIAFVMATPLKNPRSVLISSPRISPEVSSNEY